MTMVLLQCGLNFIALSRGYAKNDKEVFYNGELIKANAASFQITEPLTGSIDAKDNARSFYQGKRLK